MPSHRDSLKPTGEDDVGHVVPSIPAAVVLVLVVDELLVPGVLQAQGPLGVGGELALVGVAAAQTAVVQGQTVNLVLHCELKQEENVDMDIYSLWG